MQKKIIPVILLLTMFISTGFVPLLGLQDTEITVVAEEAPVRLEPTADAPVMETLFKGDKVTAKKKIGEWYEIELPPDEQGYVRLGYIHQQLVESSGGGGHFKAEKPEYKFDKPQKAPESSNVQASPPRRAAKSNRLYVNGSSGFGLGFSKVLVAYRYNIEGEKTGEINIQPGGGLSFQAGIGYRLMDELRFELGIGYQFSGDSASNGSYYFSCIPISAEIKYVFPGDSFRLFAGAGPVVFLGANLDAKQDQWNGYVSYNSPFGILVEIGTISKKTGKSMYWWGSLGYMGAFGGYKWKDADFYPVSRLREMSAQGIFFNIGLGYFLY